MSQEIDLMGSTVRVAGSDVATVAQMAARIYCEKQVYSPDEDARAMSVKIALDLFGRVKAAIGAKR